MKDGCWGIYKARLKASFIMEFERGGQIKVRVVGIRREGL